MPLRLAPGVMLDRYELLCPIAQGGMAEVWLARFGGKFGFEKLVAIKTVLGAHALDPKFQQMFLDEARIISRVRHANVAEILDLGEQDGVVYHVLEWVEGAALSKLFRTFRRADIQFPPRIALRILAETCDGLHAAHEIRDGSGRSLEVVHRDVSPSNILVSISGGVKVIDFGVAKALGRMSETTTTGAVKGKLHYMSPEQALAKQKVDRRADVWSVGAVLYYLLSGRRPYEADNPVALISLLLQREAPSPLTEVPEPIAEVVERALAFDAEHRFPTAAALARALEAAAVRVYGVTTSADIASFVEQYAGAEIAEQRALIDGFLEPLRSDPSAEPKSRSATQSSVAAASPSQSQISLQTMVGARSVYPSQPRTRLLLGAGIGAVVFVGALVVALGARHALSGAETAGEASVPAAAAPAAPPEPRAEPTPARPSASAPAVEAPSATPPPTAATDARPTARVPEQPAPKPATKPATKPTAKPGCQPNYFFDRDGIKRYKPQCFE